MKEAGNLDMHRTARTENAFEILASKALLAIRQMLLRRNLVLIAAVFGVCFAFLLYFGALRTSALTNLEWRLYSNDLASTRFQDADQINTSNASNLKVAWVFHTGVLDPQAELETSPIEVGGTVYITDGHDDVFALDATTGEQKWAYKPTQIPGEMPPWRSVCLLRAK
jgi:PQQ enzyme repeat